MDSDKKKDLEMKILEVESKIPELKGTFKDTKEEHARMTVKSGFTDLKYMEMGDYRVAVAKQYITDITPEHIEYKFERSTVYYKSKGEKMKEDTHTEVTKGYYGIKSYEDVPLPRRFEYLKIGTIDTDKIHVSWIDKEGKIGPSYYLELRK